MNMRLISTISVLSITALLSLPNPSPGGWGPSGCGPVGTVGPRSVWTAPQFDSPPYWRQYNGCWYYYERGVQTAGYDPNTKVYRMLINGVWSDPVRAPWLYGISAEDVRVKSKKDEGVKKTAACDCKVCDCSPCTCQEKIGNKKSTYREGCLCADCPNQGGMGCVPGCSCGRKIELRGSGEPIQNFGINQEKMSHHERYVENGNEISGEDGKRLITGVAEDPLTDDSTKVRLTVIGTETDRKKVLGDLEGHPSLAPFKGHLLVQDYAPDNWAAARAGFITTGKPTIYLQAPDGKVLARKDSYEGPEDLATVVRKTQPNYDPKKDPTGNDAAFGFSWTELEPYLPYALFGAVLLFLRRKGGK